MSSHILTKHHSVGIKKGTVTIMKIVRVKLENEIFYGSVEGDRIKKIEGSIFGEYRIKVLALQENHLYS